MSAVTEINKRGFGAFENARTRSAFQDSLFLVLVIFVSFIFYLPGLGFYSDDWGFLARMHLSDDQSLPGLYQALYDGDIVIRQRPVQIAYLALIYRIFGLEPIAFHAANAVALTATGILLYLVVREFGQSRTIAIVLPLVYLLLPHYSTDRFWIAAHQATFSISFYFLSLYADLQALRVYPHRWGGWKILSLAGLVLSGLSYEVALPLLLLNPLIAWFGSPPIHREEADGRSRRVKFISLFAVNLIALLTLIGYKAITTVRTNVDTDLITHLVTLSAGAIRVNFGTYGVGLPYIIGWILYHQPDGTLIAVSGVLVLFIFGYLYSLAGKPDLAFPEKTIWQRISLLGLVIFGLGYAIFTFNADLWFTSASLGNRVAIAAAIGVAFVFVGIAGWLSRRLPSRWMHAAFCLSISVLAGSGFLIVNTLSSFWISAYQAQQGILEEIQQNISSLPAGSTLILDGVCLERGGAYLFTGQRDLAARLWMAYGDLSLNATVLSTSPQIGDRGLSIRIYQSDYFYPYGEDLLIYNHSQKKLSVLSNARSARQYFEQTGFVPEQDCPPGFAWGWNDL